MSDTEAETPLGDDFYQDQLRGYYVVIHLALITLGESLISIPVLDTRNPQGICAHLQLSS
jgi:hypothetical protein